MITFSELGRYGRLGNQLFQYAAVRSLSLQNGYELKIPDPSMMHWHGQPCLLGEFSIPCGFLEKTDVSKIKYFYDESDHMKYDFNFYKIPDATNVRGFFQSMKYFVKNEDQIKKELTPKKNHLDAAKQKLKSYKDKYPDHKIVSVHLRRGDNTNHTNPSKELNNMYGTSQMDEDSFYGAYLKKAFSVFANQNVKYLIFSGGSRAEGNDNSSDLEWCKQNITGENILIADPASTIEDFSLITSCDHNIISPISSFGWWAAYVNNNENKIVVAPERYHPDIPNYTHREGFYPETWRLL